MTETRPKAGAQVNDAGPNDDPKDQDSLQKQARRETSKAEGEDRSFDNDDGGRTTVKPSEPPQGDPQANQRGVGQERIS
ncbi:hypothetical protein D3C87_1586870 [compost metagenome]|jgi:hypothetical protein|nr:hypothetical protein [uncultured Brevundimonas sp.]